MAEVDMVAAVKAAAEADANRGIAPIEGADSSSIALPEDEKGGPPIPEDERPYHERTSPLPLPADAESEEEDQAVGDAGEEVPPTEEAAGDAQDSASPIEGEEEPQAETGDSGLSDDLIARAVQVGLDPKDYADAPRILEAVTADREFRLLNAGRRLLTPEEAVEEEERPSERGTRRQPSAKAEEDEVQPLLTKEAVEKLRMDFGDDVAGLMQKLDERAVAAERRARVAEAQAGDVSARIEQSAKSAEQRANEQWTDFIDTSVAGFGADYEDIYGKGTALDLRVSGNTKALEARAKFADTVRFIAAGMEDDGIVPNMEVVARMARNALHSERIAALAEQRGRETAKSEIANYNRKTAGGKPSGTRKRPMTPDEKAIAEVEKIRAARGPRVVPSLP